jgi:TatA/E family protein of Tat protein translocase
MGSLSPIHWIIVAIVLLALFGPKSLAKVGRQAGRGVRAVSDVKKDLTEVPKQIVSELPSLPARREPPG